MIPLGINNNPILWSAYEVVILMTVQYNQIWIQ